MASTDGTWKGVTRPVNEHLPTAAELAANDALIEELKGQNNFESAEDTDKRTKVLQHLQKVTIQFVKEVMSKKGKFSQAVIDSAGDIDALLVAPKTILLEDFFATFPGVLERMSPPGAIEELNAISEAFSPIINLDYLGINIDLNFVSLQLQSVPLNLELKDYNLLRGLSETSLRAINGPRVTDELLALVPQPKTFRTTLRAIKLWAQRRAIYSNMMGFPGGIAWALMVARVCQLYPNATASVMVGKFFRIIHQWHWPRPCLLKDLEFNLLPQFKVWNPEIYHSDSRHLMPVITPAFPSMCSTHNITLSTKQIILRELQRGGDLVDLIFAKRLNWKDLFEGHTFFTQDYKYYLSVIATGRTREAAMSWSGLVGSRVRTLIGDLDNDELIKVACPFNKGFERVHHCKNDDEVEAVMRGDLRYQANDVKTETTDPANEPKNAALAEGAVEGSATEDVKKSDGSEATVLYTTTHYIGLKLEEHAKKLDVSWATNGFRERCQSSPSYNNSTTYLHVMHTRNVDLPDDVFQPGEVKPTKAKKKVPKKNGSLLGADSNGAKDDSLAIKKRKLAEDADVSPNDTKRRHSGNGAVVG